MLSFSFCNLRFVAPVPDSPPGAPLFCLSIEDRLGEGRNNGLFFNRRANLTHCRYDLGRTLLDVSSSWKKKNNYKIKYFFHPEDLEWTTGWGSALFCISIAQLQSTVHFLSVILLRVGERTRYWGEYMHLKLRSSWPILAASQFLIFDNLKICCLA